ncbi:MAG: organoarsenical effux MFS transporter ArsJ [Pseudomonadota bacterium]
MAEATAPKRPDGFAAYVAVTAAYWAFMLTDGALRMLVLLHFHTLGFSPIQLAYLFLLYEFMGVVTNLSAGWIAARFGLTSTLYAGLSIQVVALLALAQLDPAWSILSSVIFVMAVQGASGVAKDLAKMSSKSAVKILAPQDQKGALFRWVALLTGSKNAVKGFGFLIGAVLLGVIGFESAVLGMAIALALILAATVIFMPGGLPQGRKSAKFSEVFSKDRQVNMLSAARLFLFGARDTWFVVGIPIYFYSVLSDGSVESNRTAFFLIGTFMAIWIIGYGFIQARAPKLLKAQDKTVEETVSLAGLWAAVLFTIPLVLAACSLLAAETNPPPIWLTIVLVTGLLAFGAVFAINSSLHSYLILAFTNAQRVTMDVGFYYMSNAAGRLFGTLVSGLSFQIGGLALCLFCSAAMLGAALVFTHRLARGG